MSSCTKSEASDENLEHATLKAVKGDPSLAKFFDDSNVPECKKLSAIGQDPGWAKECKSSGEPR